MAKNRVKIVGDNVLPENVEEVCLKRFADFMEDNGLTAHVLSKRLREAGRKTTRDTITRTLNKQTRLTFKVWGELEEFMNQYEQGS